MYTTHVGVLLLILRKRNRGVHIWVTMVCGVQQRLRHWSTFILSYYVPGTVPTAASDGR